MPAKFEKTFKIQGFMFSSRYDANQHTISSCSGVVVTVFFSLYFLSILLIKLKCSYISYCHNLWLLNYYYW